MYTFEFKYIDLKICALLEDHENVEDLIQNLFASFLRRFVKCEIFSGFDSAPEKQPFLVTKL